MADSVKVLRELLNNPKTRHACGIPTDAEIDEARLDELELWCDERIEPLKLPKLPLLNTDSENN